MSDVVEKAVARATTEEHVLGKAPQFTDEELAEIFAKTQPKSNCKRCHGRGTVGRNVTTGKRVVCSCVDKSACKAAYAVKLRKEAEKINGQDLTGGIKVVSNVDEKAAG